MRVFSFTAGVLSLAASTLVLCQTPPGTNPSTSKNVAVKYGSTVVTPNLLLPEALVANKPTASLNTTLLGTHMIMLVDLSIPPIDINTTGTNGVLAPGLEPGRTTRLHWLQTGLSQTANGTFIGSTAPIADYGGPMPGLNDIAHTYTFYLFKQPANFTLPAYDAGRDYNPISVYARMNFSVEAVANVAGAPVAANYIRVQNPNNNATGTAPNTTSTASASATTSSTVTYSTPAAYTGAAQRLTAGVGLSLGAIGAAAFAML